MRIERIVLATDFSAPARAALDAAVALAARFQARLYLFHAVDGRRSEPSELALDGTHADAFYELAERRAREELAALRAPLGSIPIVECVRLGLPADEIVAFAEEKQADVIVLGTHGRTGLRRLVVGSVAESVLRRAPCPVLAVRVGEAAEAAQAASELAASDAGLPPPPSSVGGVPGSSSLGRILVAVDDSDAARAALRAGVALARRFDGSVTAVHVVDDYVLAQATALSHLDAVAIEGSFSQIARANLDRFVEETLSPEEARTIQRAIEVGRPAEAIVRLAVSGGFQVIACGTHGRSGIRRALFGSTAEHIVRIAPCPVFAVREGKAAARLAA